MSATIANWTRAKKLNRRAALPVVLAERHGQADTLSVFSIQKVVSLPREADLSDYLACLHDSRLPGRSADLRLLCAHLLNLSQSLTNPA